jgi:two-component system OmpR family sensor kinase
LAVIVAALLAAGLTVVGVATGVMLRSSLMSQVDARLDNALAGLAAPRAAFQSDGPTDYVVMVFGSDGSLYQRWPTERQLAQPGPNLTTLTWDDVPEDDPQRFTVAAQSGRSHWRIVATRATFLAAPAVVALGLNLDQVDQTMGRLKQIVLLTALAVGVLGTAAGYILVRRSLTQLRAVEKTAAAIAQGDYSQRVPFARPGTEVGRLTSSLNAMLSQIESAFEVRRASEKRTRRFIADASHELRTPLAAIRGYGELYRMGALADPTELASALRRIEDEATRMGALVNDLLQLTRLDEGRGMRSEAVDLTGLVADAAADLRALDPSRPIKTDSLGKEAVAPLLVTGDEARLRQVMTNLVGNTVRHTPSGTPVELVSGVERSADGSAWAVVEVRDHGPGIPPEAAEQVFERFFRLDSSRSRGTGGGSGLGLAIVASVVEAHGGRVCLKQTDGGGATFRLDLPLLD